MKVYILKFHMYTSSFNSFGSGPDQILGTYASEESVKKALDKLKETFLSNGSGFKIQNNEDGHGFCGYHELGTMSFVPAYYSYQEQEVI